MAQTYKMMLGTSGKQWEQLTVKDDGRMTMTFHGTDREISHEVTENEDGWLCYPGAMYPGLASGKWNKMDDGRGKMDDVVETTENLAEQEVVVLPQPTAKSAEHEPLTMNPEPLTIERPRQPRPRRQRKPRKPVVEHQPSAISHQPSKSNDHVWLRSAGYLAAASVALVIIYETGLLIPLGLIGLATSGFLK